jgi:RNA polymerase sigma-70 factor (ECF subfamily)
MHGLEAPGISFPQVVKLVQAGDADGLSTVYDLLSRGLRPQIARRVDHQDVPDILHDVFLEVVSAIQQNQLRDARRLMGFARTIGRRKVALYMGVLIRKRRDQDQFTAVFQHHHSPCPERMLISRQHKELAARTLIQLPERERFILVRFYLQEQTQEQICEDMGLSATQFRLLKWRAKARFEQLGQRTLLGKRRGPRGEQRMPAVPASIPA